MICASFTSITVLAALWFMPDELKGKKWGPKAPSAIPLYACLIVNQPWAPSRLQHLEAGKVTAVKAASPRQQSFALNQCMRPDQEIGGHALAPASFRAVGAPRRARLESGFLIHGRINHAQGFHRLQKLGMAGKSRGGLGPDDIASDNGAFPDASLQRRRRGTAEFRIGAENIQQDIRVNRRDHLLPRNSRMSASVFLPNLAQPYTRATGSAPAILTATRRPFSSRKSSAVPALMPNFFRQILGMVTCPRSATVAFIKACLDEYGMKSYLTKIRPKTSYLSHE